MSKVGIIAEQNSPTDEQILVHEILIEVGQSVKKDQVLFIAEGAKSLFDIVSPVDGKVTEIQIKSGEYSEIGQMLALIEF